ncbi:MAG: hypothetical protein BWY82_03006 [Verrucomicrobia bacterium ADurb.Bin474]|nr:MAG: hypothetical protein BWY82_03006 [Verrucomicrobia bacterium ADurb.Bin474]
MHRQVETAKPAGLVRFLNPIDGELRCGVLLVFCYESGGRYKHASRTAGGVEDATMVRLDHFSQESDNAAGCVELSSTLAFTFGKCSQEILVDATKGIVVQRSGDLRYFFEQFLQQRAAE